MNIKAGDIVFISPECKNKFEVGEVTATDPIRNSALFKSWGLRKHPSHETSDYKYGILVLVLRSNLILLKHLQREHQKWHSRGSHGNR